MRVITGSAKGLKLNSFAGLDARPTTDKVKEAMFSIIQGFVHDSYVLDLFAGSGSLGIEALSRGAKFCDFVEEKRAIMQVVKENLERTRMTNYSLHTRLAESYLSICNQKYDLVFVDPPYNKGLCNKTLNLLKSQSLLLEGAIVVCETSKDEEVESLFPLYRQAIYGAVKITIFENT